MRPQQGFTLFELIIVVVILSVLAVSLLPRFFTNSGTAEYQYRDQALSLLRRVQMQAMQCTANNCPDASVSVTATAITLATLHSEVLTINPKDAVVFSPTGIVIRFNNMGRPVDLTGEAPVTVNINNLKICINREGYIYAPKGAAICS